MISYGDVKNFHPIYRDIFEIGFDFYVMQQFISDEKKLEVALMGDFIYTPENGGRFIDLETFERANGSTQKIGEGTLSLFIYFIGVTEKGQGKGRQLLQQICDIADKYNMAIIVQIQPDFGVSYDSLVSFYKEFGFQEGEFEYMRPRKRRKSF